MQRQSSTSPSARPWVAILSAAWVGSRRAALFASAMVFTLAFGCGGEPEDAKADAKGDVDAEDTAKTVDAGADSAGDAADTIGWTVKWTQSAPPLPGEAHGGAIVPGQPGHFVLVGEQAAVAVVTPTGTQLHSIPGAGSANLHAAYVGANGEAVVGGSHSVLATGVGDEWQLVAAIPPTPPATFRAVDGHGGSVWAVGNDGVAWRRDDKGVWLSEAVSVTEGAAGAPAAALPPGADFTAVAVAEAGKVVYVGVDLGNEGGALLEKVEGGWRRLALQVAPAQVWRAPGGVVYLAGGALEPFVARWDGAKLEQLPGLQWSLGFRSVRGAADNLVFFGARKGQLRRFDGKAVSVVDVAPPVGTPKPFPAPSADLLAVLPHGPDDVLVVTAFYTYRYGLQP